ncbi:maleylpyruvate isomerase family mycothiol-dependent enzyme [soil metagenome]
MSETADRFATAAAGFTKTVRTVDAGAWDNPSPCTGWNARDIVRHVVEWVPGFYGSNANLTFPEGPSVDDDPLGAWTAMRDEIVRVLADPVVCAREFYSQAGRMSVEQSIGMIVTGDVLIHTWDLARATGTDEALDPVEVHRMFEGVQPFDQILRSSGQFGERVMVADTADEQTKLLAFMGRQP